MRTGLLRWAASGLLVFCGGCPGNPVEPDASSMDSGAAMDGGADGGRGLDAGAADGGADGGTMGPACASPCADGTVCIDGSCVDVGPSTMSCGCEVGSAGAGETCYPAYGVFPDSEAVWFVDDAAAAGGDGTIGTPFRTIGAAMATLEADGGSGTVAVAAGNYVEDLTVADLGGGRVTLRGTCASRARLSGQLHVTAATGAGSFTLAGFTVAPDGYDLAAMSDWGACSDAVEPRGVSFVSAPGGVSAEVQETVIAGWCTGLYFSAAPASPSTFCLHRSRVCANHQGVDLEGGPSLTAGAGSCLALGYGAVIQRSLIDQNRAYGVFADRATRTVGLTQNAIMLTGTLGTRTDPVVERGLGVFLGNLTEGYVSRNHVSSNLGGGLAIRNLTTGGVTADAIEILGNTFSSNAGVGLALLEVQSSTPVMLMNNTISSTGAPISGEGGDGIEVTVSGGTSYAVTITGNRIEGSARDGIMLEGVSGDVSSNTIVDSGAYGLLLQNTTVIASTNTISGSGSADQSSDDLGHGTLPIPIPIP